MQESTKKRWLLILGVIPAIIVAVLVYSAVPVYIAMYSGYEGELPVETQLVFSYYKWIFILPLGVFLVWSRWPKRAHRGLATALIGIVGSIITVLVGYWATFQPEIIITLIKSTNGQP